MDSQWDTEKGTAPSSPSVDHCRDHKEMVARQQQFEVVIEDFRQMVKLLTTVQMDLKAQIGRVGLNGERGSGLAQVLADLSNQIMQSHPQHSSSSPAADGSRFQFSVSPNTARMTTIIVSVFMVCGTVLWVWK